MDKKQLKKRLSEILDANNEIIGNEKTPEFDINADSEANKMTDQNRDVEVQPYDNSNNIYYWGFGLFEDIDKYIEEDVVAEKKDEDTSISNKKISKEVLDKKIKQTADLLNNKFNKTELNKLINLLEKIKK